jgi:hypothetical protein
LTTQPRTLAVPPERGGGESQQFVPRVRPTRSITEVKVDVDELLQTEMVGEGGRQEEPRVGHQAVVVEGRVKPVEAVRRSHLSGAPLLSLLGGSHRQLLSSEGHLLLCLGS